ncbi:hypothetical protein LTS18_011199, partial [Coniosporium uncinatum]
SALTVASAIYPASPWLRDAEARYLASLSISAVFIFIFIKTRGTQPSDGLIWLPVLASFLCARSLLNVIERFTWDWELGALAQSDAGDVVIMILEYLFMFWIFFGTLK